MARVTAEEVKALIPDADAEIGSDDITPFITAANITVTDVCTDSSLTDDQLKEIERWLAAHFVSIKYTRIDMERAGDVSQSYQYRVGLNLQVTMYGQQAMMIDTSGALAKLNRGKTRGASVSAVDPIPTGTSTWANT